MNVVYPGCLDNSCNAVKFGKKGSEDQKGGLKDLRGFAIRQSVQGDPC